jgi:hypothetical protein
MKFIEQESKLWLWEVATFNIVLCLHTTRTPPCWQHLRQRWFFREKFASPSYKGCNTFECIRESKSEKQ